MLNVLCIFSWFVGRFVPFFSFLQYKLFDGNGCFFKNKWMFGWKILTARKSEYKNIISMDHAATSKKVSMMDETVAGVYFTYLSAVLANGTPLYLS